jgi:hypothetical protein
LVSTLLRRRTAIVAGERAVRGIVFISFMG